MTVDRDEGGEKLHFVTIRIPDGANNVLAALATTRRVSRQTIIQPVVEDYALAHGPIVVEGLQAIKDSLEHERDFPVDYFPGQIDALHTSLSERFPLFPLNPSEPAVTTGIRITDTARIIYRTVAILEGHTRVSPQIEPLINGHALSMTHAAHEELQAYAQGLLPPNTGQ